MELHGLKESADAFEKIKKQITLKSIFSWVEMGGRRRRRRPNSKEQARGLNSNEGYLITYILIGMRCSRHSCLSSKVLFAYRWLKRSPKSITLSPIGYLDSAVEEGWVGLAVVLVGFWFNLKTKVLMGTSLCGWGCSWWGECGLGGLGVFVELGAL